MVEKSWFVAGAPLCVAAVVAATIGFSAGPAAAETNSWLPVNICGETGFNPAKEPPTPGGPLLPSIPPTIAIPIPYPDFVPVPVPGPTVDQTRVAQDLPADPCADPCPDLTDEIEEPQPEVGSSGSSGSSALHIPKIEIDPRPETIPIPVPGGPGPAPQPAPPVQINPAERGSLTEALGTPAVGDVRLVSQLTGHGSDNRTDKRWQVDGTDLGIIWETKPGEVAIAFGDTFGKDWNPPGAFGEDWRSNVLGHSTDTDLSDGMTIDSMVQDSRCHAAEIIDSRHIPNFETTTIPTSGFTIGNRQFLSYMSVKRWSVVPGMWYTNYGGIAYSDDNGQTWTKDQHAKWHNIFGARFQVSAMVPHGDYVYMFGTPNGRIGTIGLARVPVDQVLNTTSYQYWSNGTWTPVSEHLATPIVGGVASELSVRYDTGTGTWLMSYLEPIGGRIILRQSSSPQGVWSGGATLVDTADYPKAYGGFIHPWSTDKDLYFTMSEWDSYNVYLMHASLR
ncbi:DUF4185 domain-containing protein [Rhodococcus oxybenzonivorans]|uniref:DUF4185 domain-containing protein n=1 Tax=Rhodococcus oxybenzonivorans TaxID=1990687 RepID=UPI00295385B6|nr:DUF4185 domain-containing protein [Rhodococcus oxybenzonivorans]MDV7356390.1 DUF4185 domain-containing protein [Rhodococcus oxybenzonivorans]